MGVRMLSEEGSKAVALAVIISVHTDRADGPA